MKCGVCGNPTHRRRMVYMLKGRQLVRAKACALCFGEALHLVVAPPLQLTKESEALREAGKRSRAKRR